MSHLTYEVRAYQSADAYNKQEYTPFAWGVSNGIELDVCVYNAFKTFPLVFLICSDGREIECRNITNIQCINKSNDNQSKSR